MTDSAGAPTDIAIIGMAGRFPGCGDVEQFWRKLADSVECIRQFTDEELLAVGVCPQDLKDPRYVKAAGPLEEVDGFDAAFFGYSPKDAAILDPQHRHFYECAWTALEHAGYTATRFRRPIGVFAGCGPNLYFMRNVIGNPELQRSVGFFLLRHTGNDRDFLPTGVSYKLNLRGPSVAIQTACSTSLVAIHMACQSLLSGECDMALAGGVTIDVPHGHGYHFRENEIYSPDGHCRAFDAQAAGTVITNGCGVITLRRAEDAVAEGDFIHALIKGSAVNNDGANKVGFLAPSVDGHAEVVAEALALAGLTADQISYVEAHGTGTAVGDPIEIAALTEAFRRTTQAKQFCPIGSVKATIGHTDTAAGVAGVIKVVQSLKHRQIPKSLNFDSPNPSIDFASSPFFVNAELRSWETDGEPRRAGVSSLGVGGTNAHAVLEEAPQSALSPPARPWQTLLLSAKTPTAADAMVANLATYLRAHSDTNLADVAYTLQVGREGFDHRRALVARDLDDAVEIMERRDPKRIVSGSPRQGEPSVVFMFPGGGSQYPNMGRDLYESEDVYRAAIDECLTLLAPFVDFDLRALMFPPRGKESEAADRLRQVCASICAIFTTEYATAQLLMSWGIEPDAMTGHSLGEYTAACIAGVFSLQDALKIVALRGKLLETTSDASMMTVPLPESDVRELLGDELDLAAINGPSFCLISGMNDRLELLERQLAEQDVECRRLHLAGASHCRFLDPVLDEFLAGVKSVQLHAPKRRYVSNVTGTWIQSNDAQDPQYWVRHLRQCVRFSQGLDELLQDPHRVLLEVGPGHTLCSLARQQQSKPAATITSLRHPDEQWSDVQFIRTTLCRLWAAGLPIDWSQLGEGSGRRRLPLPTYPFEHRSYWLEPVAGVAARAPAIIDKLESLDDWFYEPKWVATPIPKSASEDKRRTQETILIFLDRVGVGTQIAARMRNMGRQVVTVREGDAFYRFGEHEYALAPEEGRAGYDELFADLCENDRLPSRILHLWLLTKDHIYRPGSSLFHHNQERGVYSLFFLAQALGEQDDLGPLHMDVITTGMQAAEGEVTEQPDKATVLGPIRVIPREYPHITCSAIDIAVLPQAAAPEVIDQIIAEQGAEAGNRIVLLRGGKRFEPKFERVRPSASDATPAYRQHGVYLITGGLGGIGLMIADHLARTCKARLILIGRAGLPVREQWDNWLEVHSEHDPTSRKIQAIRRMEALGAQVLTADADVAHIDRMQVVISEARHRFGAIHGVIHAAAVLEDGVIQGKTADAIDRVFTPKVHGTLLLADLLKDDNLDFFLLFSSTSAILGPAGQADYTAANCFLNAFANSRLGRQVKAIAINWGVWKTVGMGRTVALRMQGTETDERQIHRRVSHPLFDECLTAEPDEFVFTTALSPDTQWILDEHRMQSGIAVIPGTGYLELCRGAFAEVTGAERVEFRDLSFVAPLTVADHETREMRTILSAQLASSRGRRNDQSAGTPSKQIQFKSHSQGDWLLHASGSVMALHDARPPALDLQAIRDRCPADAPTDGHGLPRIRQIELLRFGPRWRVVRSTRFGEREAIAELALPEPYEDDLRLYELHPALLDLATGFALPLISGYAGADVLYVPSSYERVRVHDRLPPRVFSYVRSAEENNVERDVSRFDVTISDEQGTVLVEIQGFAIRKMAPTESFHQIPSSPRRSAIADHQSAGERLFLETYAAGIDTEEGLRVIDRLLSAPNNAPHQVVASSVDLHVLFERFNELEEVQAEPAVKFARPNLSSTYAAPSDPLEKQLADFWEELLGVDDIGIHDDFFELGGHSLIAVRLFAKIKKTWDVEYPISVLFEAPTIAGCADLLREEVGEEITEDGLGAEKPASRRRHRYLVPMNRVVETDRPPFFLVAGMFGNVLNLRHLAGHLGADQPVYAIQARGLHGDERPHTRFEEMASAYLEEVRQLQAQGPYLLGGFSGGDISAYEMAQQLKLAGEEVGILVMLDTPPPPQKVPQLTWRDRLLIQLFRLRRHGVGYLRDWAVSRWQWEKRRFRPPELEELTPAEFRSREVQAGFVEALSEYPLPSYDGDIHLFRPKLRQTYSLGRGRFANDDRVLVEPRNHWSPFIHGTIHVHEVSGDHDGMVLEPHVRVLAAELSACLRQATIDRRIQPPEIVKESHDGVRVLSAQPS